MNSDCWLKSGSRNSLIGEWTDSKVCIYMYTCRYYTCTLLYYTYMWTSGNYTVIWHAVCCRDIDKPDRIRRYMAREQISRFRFNAIAVFIFCGSASLWDSCRRSAVWAAKQFTGTVSHFSRIQTGTSGELISGAAHHQVTERHRLADDGTLLGGGRAERRFQACDALLQPLLAGWVLRKQAGESRLQRVQRSLQTGAFGFHRFLNATI